MQKKIAYETLNTAAAPPCPLSCEVDSVVVCRIPSGISLELELAACVLEPCGILNMLEKKDFCHK